MEEKKKLITIVLGTRPEAIKLAPVIGTFKKCKQFKTRVITTGQHKEMVHQVLKIFDIKIQKDLNIMKRKQTLTQITCLVLNGLKEDFIDFRPNLVIVQGDTSTAFAAALAAFYEQIPVGHVEAGLRTNKLNDPFPEEANRRLISQIGTLHFSPTHKSKVNLMSSGINGIIEVTGNTVIDALVLISKKNIMPKLSGIDWKKKVIFVSVHRRENWGLKLLDIIQGLKMILEEYKDVVLLLPLHPNPIVREPFLDAFQSQERVILIAPLNYLDLVGTLKNCYALLTDSGGLQEEAPSLGKPVLVLRKTTERPEAIDAGTSKLIGTDPNSILRETGNLLTNKQAYKKMSKAVNPFGDGKASQRILKTCKEFLNQDKRNF